MARTRYIYNPETCKYEPVYLKGKALRNSVLTFLGGSLVLALVGYGIYIRYVGSMDEMILKERNVKLKIEWQILEERMANAYSSLHELIDKDDHNYRVILDSNPLEPNIREAGIGGSEKFNANEIKDFPIVLNSYTNLLHLKNQLDVEVQSYEELKAMVEDKVEAWASRPAIQPINNKQLDRLHLTYGSRLHPLFHVVREHKGLDFAAQKGTPVYATGDGKIAMAYFSDSYGNVVYVNHGHDYETRYAHLSGFAVKAGEQIKRGQVIGYVGNTGNSKAAHLHYEVLFKGNHVNPINFFQRDLSNKEYDKLIEDGKNHTAPLD